MATIVKCSGLRSLVWAAGLLLAAAGCAGPPMYHDFTLERQSHELSVAAVEDVTLLAPDERARLDGFLAEYGKRGLAPLTITVPAESEDDEAALRRGRALERYAYRRGVAPGAVRLGLEVEAAEGPRLATLHFEGIKVRVPQCGDWSRPTHYNPTNALPPDFGCATRRNLGLMVANPSHLVTPAQLGLRDTARSDLIIGKYRLGEVTRAERAFGESAILAPVIEFSVE